MKETCHSGAAPQAESPEPIFQSRCSSVPVPGMTIVFVRSSLRERCDMTTQSLPAASLRPVDRLPVPRVLLRVFNYLIGGFYRRSERRFPASNRVFSLLREAPSRPPQPHSAADGAVR